VILEARRMRANPPIKAPSRAASDSGGQIAVAVDTAEAAAAELIVASVFERVENLALESLADP
jgi:hypothetical protein